MIQDAHYLVAYGRALAVTAAKSDNAEGVVQFANAPTKPWWCSAACMTVLCATYARTAKDNPYQGWVETYASEEFHAAVRGVCATVDRLAADANEATRAAMHAACKDAARLEWMFWDSAYQLGDWQQPLR